MCKPWHDPYHFEQFLSAIMEQVRRVADKGKLPGDIRYELRDVGPFKIEVVSIYDGAYEIEAWPDGHRARIYHAPSRGYISFGSTSPLPEEKEELARAFLPFLKTMEML